MKELEKLNPEEQIAAAKFFSIEAEQVVLGSILSDNDAYHRISDILIPAMFYDPVHAEIWSIAADRIAKAHLVNALTLRTIMEHHEGLKALGGPRYLVRLAAVSSPLSVRHYADVVVELARKRYITVAVSAAMGKLSEGQESNDVVAEIVTSFQGLPEPAGTESTVSMLTAMRRAVEKAVRAYQGEEVFVKTGIRALDSIIKGVGVGDLILLGGATSSGKTSLALEIAANVSGPDAAVAFWSLEMEEDELATRLASRASSVDYAQIRDAGAMEEAEFRKWVGGAKKAEVLNLRLIPKRVRDVAGGFAALMRAKAEAGGKLRLIVVDYAQLVRGPGRERTQQMVEVSMGLKLLGRLVGAPVLALVQIDRKIGSREDRRPQLTDIRETGQFENDADVVLMCHRESYWLERDGPEVGKDGKVADDKLADWNASVAAARNVMEVIVRKNRHGALGTARVGLHLPTNRFWDLEARDAPRPDLLARAEGFA